VQGLIARGVNQHRLTPYLNPVITVPLEVARAIALKNLVRRLIGSELAIARVGLGLRPAARTVSAHVRAAIFFAGLARKVACSESLTPTAVPRFDGSDGVRSAGYDATKTYILDEQVELDSEVEL
jgi:hypothetical protein